MNQAYPHIFSPIQIGDVIFKNRIWTAPAGAHLLAGREEYPNEAVVAYYANKARGGSANITISAQNMDIHRPPDLDHANENVFRPVNHRHYRHLTDAIHFYGAKASLELLAFQYHGYDHAGNLVCYAVNAGERDGDGAPMPQLTRPVMEQIAASYADAAEAALKCGFDMILIHGGHGLVLSQFLSPLFNRRDDEFGGSLENRMRFPMMVLDAIRDRVGRRLLIEYRISGSELAGDEGFTVEDCIEVLKVMQEKIDIAHISAGSFFNDTEHITHPTGYLEPGCNAYLAARVKACAEISIPVLTLGGFQDPALIEATLASGGADIVSMARGTICDAHLPEKARTGRTDEIIPCIKCFHCLDYTRADTFACSANPEVGRESRLPALVSPPVGGKRVVVVGGGPAGMQAAISARQQGHEVTLLEKSDHLGGKLVFSRQVDFKRDLCRFMDYQKAMVEKLGVTVRLNTEATPDGVRAMGADTVMVALGASAVVPPIPGIDGANVVKAEDAYALALTGDLPDDLAVIGGGLVGCETALYLAKGGRRVTLIEMLDEIAVEEFSIVRTALLEEMAKHVTVHTGAACTGVTAEGLTYRGRDGREHSVSAGRVILSAGMRPDRAAAAAFMDVAPVVRYIGDCVQAKNLRTATRTAYDAAMSI